MRVLAGVGDARPRLVTVLDDTVADGAHPDRAHGVRARRPASIELQQQIVDVDVDLPPGDPQQAGIGKRAEIVRVRGGLRNAGVALPLGFR